MKGKQFYHPSLNNSCWSRPYRLLRFHQISFSFQFCLLPFSILCQVLGNMFPQLRSVDVSRLPCLPLLPRLKFIKSPRSLSRDGAFSLLFSCWSFCSLATKRIRPAWLSSVSRKQLTTISFYWRDDFPWLVLICANVNSLAITVFRSLSKTIQTKNCS